MNALALFSVYSSVLEGDAITANDMPFDVDWYNIGSAGFFLMQIVIMKNDYVVLCITFKLWI